MSTRSRHLKNRVAAKGVSIVLALEEQGREVWATVCEQGNTRVDQDDEQGESAFGERHGYTVNY